MAVLTVCAGHFCFACSKDAVLSSLALKLPLQADLLPARGFPGCKTLSLGCRTHPDSFLSLGFLFSLNLSSYMEVFMSFKKSEVFCQCSVDVLYNSATCRCIFHIFVGGSEFHVLLHHLDCSLLLVISTINGQRTTD